MATRTRQPRNEFSSAFLPEIKASAAFQPADSSMFSAIVSCLLEIMLRFEPCQNLQISAGILQSFENGKTQILQHYPGMKEILDYVFNLINNITNHGQVNLKTRKAYLNGYLAQEGPLTRLEYFIKIIMLNHLGEASKNKINNSQIDLELVNEVMERVSKVFGVNVIVLYEPDSVQSFNSGPEAPKAYFLVKNNWEVVQLYTNEMVVIEEDTELVNNYQRELIGVRVEFPNVQAYPSLNVYPVETGYNTASNKVPDAVPGAQGPNKYSTNPRNAPVVGGNYPQQHLPLNPTAPGINDSKQQHFLPNPSNPMVKVGMPPPNYSTLASDIMPKGNNYGTVNRNPDEKNSNFGTVNRNPGGFNQNFAPGENKLVYGLPQNTNPIIMPQKHSNSENSGYIYENPIIDQLGNVNSEPNFEHPKPQPYLPNNQGSNFEPQKHQPHLPFNPGPNIEPPKPQPHFPNNPGPNIEPPNRQQYFLNNPGPNIEPPKPQPHFPNNPGPNIEPPKPHPHFPNNPGRNIEPPKPQQYFPNNPGPNIEPPKPQQHFPNNPSPSIEPPKPQQHFPNNSGPNIEPPKPQPHFPNNLGPNIEPPKPQQYFPNNPGPNIEPQKPQPYFPNNPGPNIEPPKPQPNFPINDHEKSPWNSNNFVPVPQFDKVQPTPENLQLQNKLPKDIIDALLMIAEIISEKSIHNVELQKTIESLYKKYPEIGEATMHLICDVRSNPPRSKPALPVDPGSSKNIDKQITPVNLPLLPGQPKPVYENQHINPQANFKPQNNIAPILPNNAIRAQEYMCIAHNKNVNKDSFPDINCPDCKDKVCLMCRAKDITKCVICFREYSENEKQMIKILAESSGIKCNIPNPVHNMPNPGYNQPMPGYNQPMPGYNQPNPGYNQPVPGYNQPVPGYNQPNPGYNYPNPGYNQPNPGHNQPNPGYNQPNPGYNQPNPGYNQPNPGYNQPNPGYNQPNPGYNQPNPGYNQPNPGYNQPNPGYNQRIQKKNTKFCEIHNDVTEEEFFSYEIVCPDRCSVCNFCRIANKISCNKCGREYSEYEIQLIEILALG